MSLNTQCLFALTTLIALAANACSVHSARVARISSAPLQCAGGMIQNDADLARFEGCSAISGDLTIARSQLEDLQGLEALRSVSGALVIADNDQLSDLSGLERLGSVGSLRVSDNSSLSCMRSLSNLHSAPVVEIRNNPELVSVHGLEGLSQVDQLTLLNDGLFETAGLANLRQVGELTVADNARLISLGGLNGLTRAGSVQIRNNRVLCAQLGFLPQLGEVGEALVVSSNRSVSQHEVAGLFGHVKGALQAPSVESRELALH